METKISSFLINLLNRGNLVIFGETYNLNGVVCMSAIVVVAFISIQASVEHRIQIKLGSQMFP